jgi:hypothetical protein
MYSKNLSDFTRFVSSLNIVSGQVGTCIHDIFQVGPSGLVQILATLFSLLLSEISLPVHDVHAHTVCEALDIGRVNNGYMQYVEAIIVL